MKYLILIMMLVFVSCESGSKYEGEVEVDESYLRLSDNKGFLYKYKFAKGGEICSMEAGRRAFEIDCKIYDKLKVE